MQVTFSCPTTAAASSQNHPEKSQYVKDFMWENRNRIWQLPKEGAYIYVCGDGCHMAKDVDETLCQIAVESGNMNENDGIAVFEQLQKKGGYLQDVWCN